jgi:hypothetical protein
MITRKEILDQLIANPLHTTLLTISALLLLCSGYIKPPIAVALFLLAILVYTVLYFGRLMPGLLDCCKCGAAESKSE